LTPDSDWRERYRGWPALKKLEYGEEFAESAEKAGVCYEALLRQILTLGLEWRGPGAV
jgi:hypothetical protein